MATCTVFIALYNERATLPGFLEKMLRVGSSSDDEIKLLIIDDGSTDGSGALADAWALKYEPVRVVHHAANRGLGGVYRTGFEHAVDEYITFFPADGQFDAELILNYLSVIKTADMVLGYVEGRREGVVGRFLSYLERLAYRILFGDMPKFQGIMMFRRKLLDEIPLISEGRGWGIVMELILKAHRRGYRIAHVENVIKPRVHGKSKVNNWRSIWANLKQLVVLRIRMLGEK